MHELGGLRQFVNALLAILILSSGQQVFASVTLPSNSLDVTQIALGSVCTTLRITPYTTPCNPAFAATEHSTYFLANIFLGDNYATVKDFEHLVETQHYQELMERIYKENRQIDMQTGVTLYFLGPHFNLNLSPERLFYYSRTSNPNYPTYDIEIVKERSFSAQFGGPLSDEWNWGLQTRLVNREYHIGNFSLFDALAGDPDIFIHDEQTALFLEPGLLYLNKESTWHPRWSLFVGNWGLGGKKAQAPQMEPTLEMGIGFATPQTYAGRLELGLTYRWAQNPTFLDSDAWRWGGIYHWGLVNASFSWSEARRAIGVISSFDHFRVGLLYESRKQMNYAGKESYEDMVSTEFGLAL